MSIKLMTLVWELSLPASEKIVLLALADNANDEGLCWPSIATIARKSSKSERTVQGTIQSLCRADHLSREAVPGKGCRYTVHPRRICTPAESAPAQNSASSPAESAPKPSRTTKSSEAKASSDRTFILPGFIPEQEWQAFEQMRRRLRKPLTNHARHLAVEKLRKLAAEGHDPREVLDQSVFNGWHGLFAIKENRNEAGTHSSRGHAAGSRADEMDRAYRDLLSGQIQLDS